MQAEVIRARVGARALSPAARPLRFAATGLICAAMQLALLTVLTRHGLHELIAYPIAFLLAAQLNFALSSTFTWRERGGGSLPRRWAVFHASIAAMAVLNFLVFAAARTHMPVTAAAVLGILAGSIGNYTSGEALVFRGRRDPLPHAPTVRGE